MNVARLLAALSIGPVLWSADRIEVGLCNVGQTPSKELARAKATADYVFGVIGVDIVWSGCGAPTTAEASADPRFVLRLMDQSKPPAIGHWTPDAFGRAYLTADATGDYAEIYCESVRQVAVSNHFAEKGDILGYVVAHELGHLLLGPRHSSNGIMKVRWNVQDLLMMTQQRMRFSQAERTAMHREIQVRTHYATAVTAPQ